MWAEALMILLLWPLLAVADIPPPRGYVETCTVERQCGTAESGTTCDGWHGGREACEALEAKGWTRKCQTAGASTWTEVFCAPEGVASAEAPAGPPAPTPTLTQTEEPPTAPPETPTSTEEEKRCAHGPAPAAWWLLGLSSILVRRRRNFS